MERRPAFPARPAWQSPLTADDLTHDLLTAVLASTAGTAHPIDDITAGELVRQARTNAWIALRLLHALQAAAPDLADDTIASLGEDFDDGDYVNAAWSLAQQAGHRPQDWINARAELLAARAAQNSRPAPAATA